MPLIVLGMHQSGASVAADLIERMGGQRPDLRRLHEEILHSCDTEWQKIDESTARQIASAELESYQGRARQILGELEPHQPWVLQESSLCFLVPFWRPFLENPVCLHVVRNPMEVASALKKHHGLSIQHGLALWELSTISGLQNARGLPQIMVHHEDLRDPVRLRKQLEAAGVEGLLQPLENRVEFESNLEEPGYYLNHKQLALYEALQSQSPTLADDFYTLSEGAVEALSIQKTIRNTSQANLRELAEVQKSSRSSWKTHLKLTRLQESAKNNLEDSLSLLQTFRQEHLKTLNSLPWILGNLLHFRWKILSRTTRLRRLRELEAQIEDQRYKIQQSSSISMSESEQSRRNRQKKPRPVAVIIPVFNAYEEVVTCIENLLQYTRHPHEILLIDDRSTDERVWPKLRAYAKAHDHIRAIRNRKNLGYTRTVNMGCEFARPCDVILLNSDTIVTPFWLEKLTAVAYSRADVATVTAISNAAGNFSVPINKIDNPMPDDLTPSEFAGWVERLSRRRRPAVPCGNGFCLFVLRSALEKVGPFDEVSFPRGYGEENDFCMRARKLGLLSLIDDATFIYHKRTASFGAAAKAPLLEASKIKLQELHPDYVKLRTEWLKNDPVDELRAELQKAPWSRGFPKPQTKPVLLYVIHASGGGTRFTSEDLIRGMMDHYEVLLLETAEHHWTLLQSLGTKLTPLRRYHFAERWEYYQILNGERVDVWSEILSAMKVGLVHFRHLIGNGPEALALARQKGLRVVLSLHDFYTICPTTTLLDERLQFCGGHCTPGEGKCDLRGRWFDNSGPVLKHAHVHVHRKLMADAMECDALVTTSMFSRNLFVEFFPHIASRLHVIEHGRDLQREDFVAAPVVGQPMRVICLGNMSVPKGMNLIREIMALDQAGARRFEFHFLGSLPKEITDLPQLGGVLHGRYKREHLNQYLQKIGPSFSIVSSIWPETYCHTLTESWAVGLPVFASNIGTLQERVEEHGGGWLLDYRSAEAWYRGMLAVVDNPAEFEQKRGQIRQMPGKTVAKMTGEYLEIYQSLEDRSATARSPMLV